MDWLVLVIAPLGFAVAYHLGALRGYKVGKKVMREQIDDELKGYIIIKRRKAGS